MDWPRHPADSLSPPCSPLIVGALLCTYGCCCCRCCCSLCAFASHFDLKAARQTKIKMGEKTTKQASKRKKKKNRKY